MILKRLAINRLPGIDEPFEIEAAGQGIQVIFGPNGIGKSSISRAVEGLYWQERGSSRQTSVSGEFQWDGEIWLAEREASSLRWSRGSEENLSPGFPAPHNNHCFFLRLRELVDPSPDSTIDIATAIRRQMSGGFDLDEISSDLFSPVTRHRKRAQRKRFNAASDDIQRAELSQAGLQKRVDEVELLESQLKEAEAAAERLVHVVRAIGLAKRRDELEGIREKLSPMPDVLANLTGKERENVKQYQEHLTKLEQRARRLERVLDEAREEQKKSGLDCPLEAADLAEWRDNADELGRTEVALNTAKTDREAARRKLAGALKAVGGGNIDTTTLSLPKHAELFEFLRAVHSHSARIDATRERLRLLEGVESPENGDRDLERFRNAAEALRTWLRVPPPESLAVRARKRWRWLLLAFAILAGGTVLVWLLDPLLVSFAGLGAGIGLAALFLDRTGDSGHRRQAAQATYKALGLDEPTDWKIPAVGALLANQESNRTDLEASLKRSRDRGVEKKALQNHLDLLTEKQGALDIRRRKLQAALDLEYLPPDAELVDFAWALDQLRLARGDFEATNGMVQRHENRHDAHLTKLANILDHHDEPRPVDATAAKARLNRLADRNTRLEKALAEEKQAKSQLEESAADRNLTRASIAQVYAESGLHDGDWQGLESLLEALPRYDKLAKQKADLKAKIELDRAELLKAGESELGDREALYLDNLSAELEDIASRARQLRGDIADVTAQMKRARRGRDLQDLIAVREEARLGLRDLREQALFATAGDFLIEEVEREYEQTRMPRVFERTRKHFSDFTYHNYEARLEKSGGTPRLFAIDLRARQRRDLGELSDGTRIQLLLAARMAFAEEVEQGKVLPLFLDEALDQSDPRRFEAIVRILGRVAREQGRQIIYLTSDPLDVDRIRHALSREDIAMAEPVDLGLLRTGQASVSGPEALTVEPRPILPRPDGLSPEAYGAALGVPALRPAQGFAVQHVYYVLWDDLELLHAFLSRGIERAGQWKTVSGTPLAERLGKQSIASAQISLRLDLLETFCELWIQGRGRRVDSDALLDSGVLGRRYFDDVVAIAQDVDGNPEQLLDILAGRKDPRLKGFLTRNVERLQGYLTEHEYIDERPILIESELRLHALATPAANKLKGDFIGDCLHRWWRWAIRSGSPEPETESESKAYAHTDDEAERN